MLYIYINFAPEIVHLVFSTTISYEMLGMGLNCGNAQEIAQCN